MMRKVLLTLVLVALSASMGWSVDFDHRDHLEEYFPGLSCHVCHVPDAKSIVPDKEVCLFCHDKPLVDASRLGTTKTHGVTWALNHRTQAKSDDMECTACHRQSDCFDCHAAGFADEQGDFGNAMINVHKSDFHVTHPVAARTDQQLCASCHESRFCSDCHDSFRGRTGRTGGPSHARFFGIDSIGDIETVHAGMTPETNCDNCHLQGSVAPSFHAWSTDHARDARRNLATCQACHPGGDVCLNCHSAKGGVVGFNPHGKNWGDRAGRLKDASNGKTCRRCHDQY